MTGTGKKQDIEVTIKPDGTVEFHLVGFGKACDDYIKVLKEILHAQVKDTKFTSEYYSTTTQTGVTTRRDP
jgi:hypothetical protein